jgi:4-amino-4-deoxy-L-arabinose transferase-like glycosyltransferase
LYGPEDVLTHGRWLAALALGAIVAGALLTVPTRHLWEPDEPRYAEVAREMLATGRWVLPQLNGRPYAQKPPLYMWFEAAGRSAGLGWTAAGVLPSLLPFLALLALLPAMARDLGLEDGAGWLAVAVLAASPLATTMALAARMDMLLTLFFTLSVWLLFKLLRAEERDHLRRAHLVFWAAVALGVLTKGPVALALPAVTLTVVLVTERPRPSLRPVLAGWGPALFAAVVLAWIVPAVLSGGPEYARNLLLHQSLGRITKSFAHSRPFYYHLVTFPFTGLPFSLAGLVGVLHGLRRRRPLGSVVLGAAVVAVFGFFSLISGKLLVYLLPLLPPSALLVAHAVLANLRGVRAALGGGAVITMTAGAALATAPVWRPDLFAWSGGLVAAGTFVAVLGLAALLLLVRGGSALKVSGLLALSGLAFPVLVLPAAARLLDGRLSVAREAEEIERIEPDRAEGLSYRDELAGLSLYAGKTFSVLETEEELEHALRRGRTVATRADHWMPLEDDLGHLVAQESSYPLLGGAVVVLRGGLANGASAP